MVTNDNVVFEPRDFRERASAHATGQHEGIVGDAHGALRRKPPSGQELGQLCKTEEERKVKSMKLQIFSPSIREKPRMSESFGGNGLRKIRWSIPTDSSRFRLFAPGTSTPCEFTDAQPCEADAFCVNPSDVTRRPERVLERPSHGFTL